MADVLTHFLNAAKSGDRDAFEALVRRFLPSVHEIVRETSRGRGVPAELVQETFQRAWRGLGGLTPRVDFGRWLGGIARYVAHEAARRRKPFAVSLQRSPRDITRDRVFEALDGLDGRVREALLLRHLDRATRAVTAMRLNVLPSELDALLRTGREALVGRLPTPDGGPA
jgi:RNA polymerase sigma-70 factor (ECF subfamily)